MIHFQHDAPGQLRLGLVIARGLEADVLPKDLDHRIDDTLDRRSSELSEAEDRFRRTVRDVFRNGSYKPTGRGKPASEYLVRTAKRGRFPRINAPVDICNYLSLKTLYPISLWDIDRAGGSIFRVRLGQEGERYIFNSSGQEIRLTDLIVGCVCEDKNDPGRPIVNAVKDCEATKTRPETSSVAALVYAPLAESPVQSLADTCKEFAHLLNDVCPEASADHAVLTAGRHLEL